MDLQKVKIFLKKYCFLKSMRKRNKKKKVAHEKEQQVAAFFWCKDSCVSIKKNSKCDAFKLCYCRKSKPIWKVAQRWLARQLDKS